MFTAAIVLAALLPLYGLGQEENFYKPKKFNEFTVSYTAGSVLSLGNLMENLIWDVIIQPIDPLISSSGTSWGGFSVGYNHWMTRHVALGGTFAFSKDVITEQRKTSGEWTYNSGFFSGLMTVKVNYVATPWVDVYARADLGGTIIAGSSTNAGTTSNYAGYIFAGQFSPICLRVGKTFNFFVEAGFGTIGLVNTGFTFRF